MSKPKIIVTEVLGSASSGKPECRLGYRVTEIYNTTRYKIGQDLHRAEVDELLELLHWTVVIRGTGVYSDKLIPHPSK